MSVQVFTPYQGRIIALFAKVGDDVKKGQTLFTIDSPDLLQAESTLIAAAGVLELTTQESDAPAELYKTRAVSQHDLEQAISDQQTAEGDLRAARDAVRIFGKTDAEIDRIVADRARRSDAGRAEPDQRPRSPRGTPHPGLLVQPGNPPAPYTVADIDTMWMLANVAESDSPAFRVGQEVKVTRRARFRAGCSTARSSTIGASVDPNTRRRPGALRDRRSASTSCAPGMFANFVIRIGAPVRSPAHSARRRGARGRRHDDGLGHRRPPPLHQAHRQDRRLQRDGYRQILEGVQAGELVADRGRAVPEQRARDGVAHDGCDDRVGRSRDDPNIGMRDEPC